jgi:hypothetical protein
VSRFFDVVSQRAIALIGALVMAGFSAREVVRRGVGPAKTIVSRTGLSPRNSEEALLLLEHARGVLPRCARVVFLDAQKKGNWGVAYGVAIGQLAQQSVLTYEELDHAEYFVVLHGAADPPFVLVRQFEEGGVYRRP